MKFTLDTNCLIDVEECRPGYESVRLLADAHKRGDAQVAVVAISASEKQKDGIPLKTFDQFLQRLEKLGLAHLEILRPIFYFDVSFWDWAYWAEPEMQKLEISLHGVLFPNVAFHWADYCKERGLDPQKDLVPGRWHNAKCDVQAMWSHIHHGHDVFVTADGNFHAASKQQALVQLGAGRILEGGAASRLVSQLKY